MNVQSFARQKRRIQTKLISFKDTAIQLQQLQTQYIRSLNARSRVTKKALLVGINYLGKSTQLYGCINDVQSVQAHLVSKGFTCQCITDQTALKPTRVNILNAFTRLLTDAVAGDTLVFQYSGHGSFIRDKNRDEVVTFPSSWCHRGFHRFL